MELSRKKNCIKLKEEYIKSLKVNGEKNNKTIELLKKYQKCII